MRRSLSRFSVALLAVFAPLALGDARVDDAEPPPLVREFRGAWVTPLTAGTAPDWPSRPGLSADSQRAELRAVLDHAQALGLNAIVLHVRTASDALYPTKLAPWSAFLSGTSGVAPRPAYDPLAFAVTEAHARGLQLHAWFNPFRAMLPNFKGKAAASHVTRAHPSWIRSYGTQTWIDPGEPAARAAILAAIMEVVERYDVDGVHIDDYFYPYREQRTVVTRVKGKRVTSRVDIAFPDDATWKKYGAGKGFATRADWRRHNVDTLVHALYTGVKARKPWVAVGISPFGIWRPGSPPGLTGLDAYGEIYADARKWLREGWLDYLAPQLYWPLDGEQQRFIVLDEWWRSENRHGRHIWPGLFTAKAALPTSTWRIDEIGAQIGRARGTDADTDVTRGHVHFRMGALIKPTWLGTRLRQTVYTAPAIPPAMPWLSGAPPTTPSASVRGDSLFIVAGDSVPAAGWVIRVRETGGEWSTLLRYGSTAFNLSDIGATRAAHIAVVTLDRVGQASPYAIIESTPTGWRPIATQSLLAPRETGR
jgi:uncharacterized lipoprotein YddW (UPF0748 family)